MDAKNYTIKADLKMLTPILILKWIDKNMSKHNYPAWVLDQFKTKLSLV